MLDWLGMMGGIVLAIHKRIPLLGFRSEIEFSLRFSLNRFCVVEQIFRPALTQFEFKFLNPAGAASSYDFPQVDGKLDLDIFCVDRQSRAVNPRLENWSKLFAKFFRNKAFYRRPLGLTQIRGIA